MSLIQNRENSSNRSSEDEMSLRDLVVKISLGMKYLGRYWKFILICSIIGGLLGLGYSVFKRPVYTAETTFVLEESGSGGGGLGQYAGLASVVGIDIGGGSADLFSGDNIIQLYQSRAMIEKTLLSIGSFNNAKQLLIDRFIQFNDLGSKWEQDPKLKDISFGDTTKFSIVHDSLINQFVNEIKKNFLDVSKPDKKLSIIKVSFVSKDELFAKQFSELLVKNVSDFFIHTKTKKTVENVKILQHQTDSVRAVLDGAIFSSAVTLDATPNLNPVKQVLRAPVQRSQMNVEANKAILSELIKNLELSKYTLRKERPLIQLIDGPVLPLEKYQVSKFTAIGSGIAISALLAILFLFSRSFYFETFKTKERT
ncbi:MAG: Wzz/FepE/Etk N-terminal domain-containing protein [Daejeonella sp.]